MPGRHGGRHNGGPAQQGPRGWRFRVLRLLHDNPELFQREPAEAIGISNGGAHDLLSALLDKGMIKFENFTAAQDKRRYAYILTPKGIAESGNFRNTMP